MIFLEIDRLITRIEVCSIMSATDSIPQQGTRTSIHFVNTHVSVALLRNFHAQWLRQFRGFVPRSNHPRVIRDCIGAPLNPPTKFPRSLKHNARGNRVAFEYPLSQPRYTYFTIFHENIAKF